MNEKELKELIDIYIQFILDDIESNNCGIYNIQDIILNIFCKLEFGTLTKLGKSTTIDEMLEIYDIATTTLCTDGRNKLLKWLKKND